MGSDIPFSSCTFGWEYCKIDGDFQHGNGQIEINGHMYEKGIVQHAAGVAKFTLGGEYIVFSSCIGISKYAPDSRCGVSLGDARFRIKGDNVVLRDWEVKDSPEDPTCFEIGTTDVEELELEVDLNSSRDCDFSTWADAKVFRPGDISIPVNSISFHHINLESICSIYMYCFLNLSKE